MSRIEHKGYKPRNIIFFWNQKRSFKENVFHAIASSFFILCILITLIFIPIYLYAYHNTFKNNPNDLYNQWWVLMCSISIFITLLCGIIVKFFYERKARKERKLYNLTDSEITTDV